MQRSRTISIVIIGLCCVSAMASACASGTTAGSIDIEKVAQPPDPAPGSEYTIQIGDLLDVQVWDQDKMSAKTRVRNDGRISLPFLNDVEAAGKTPVALSGELETGLKAVVLNPRVTVVVEESRLLTVSVLGEVAKQGALQLEPGAGVVQAIAAAGGLSTFAHKDRIFVVRSTPQPIRIHFTFKDLTSGTGKAQLFRLRNGDVIVVE